jgi:hypothetical protein
MVDVSLYGGSFVESGKKVSTHTIKLHTHTRPEHEHG